MLAIFVLFIQAKFGYSAAGAATIYASFLAFVYFMPLIGGIIADKVGYGKMVTTGIFVMFIGYLLLAIPMGSITLGKAMMFGALALICIGTGLFKGNLQVLVGNLYDDPKYASKRDAAFSIFYMAINVGAMFAPTAATAMTNWMLGKAHFTYDAQIPALAHQYLEGGASMSPDSMSLLNQLMAGQHWTGDISTFCTTYINKLSEAYNYGFGIACISLIFSIIIYFAFRSTFKHADINSKQAQEQHVQVEEVSPAETKQRITALVLVFAVVLFFWMAFHQNGLTLTFFARDYTAHAVTGLTRLVFDIWNLVLIVFAVYGLFAIFQSKTGKGKTIASVIVVLSIVGLIWRYFNLGDAVVNILPQQFQQFNPFFVVALTPVSVALFNSLANKGKEPSAPRKIGMGMVVAAIGFCIMALGSIGMPKPAAVAAGTTFSLASPNLLISTYLVLTFGELLLSPMGISFVSKVAPPKYKGLMMGGWFVATAIGNYMVAIIGYLWDSGMNLWSIWSVLIVLCVLSAVFIFSIMKRLEKVS
jgi:POT family proton-dependent oligopeptide transporter